MVCLLMFLITLHLLSMITISESKVLMLLLELLSAVLRLFGYLVVYSDHGPIIELYTL